jgi:hypothetical protein
MPPADPTSYFEQYPAADILASSDQLLPTIKPSDTGLEDPHAVHSALNIGGWAGFGGVPPCAACAARHWWAGVRCKESMLAQPW